MKNSLLQLAAATCIAALAGCTPEPVSDNDATASSQHATPTKTNTLLQNYQGPYGGVPAFDKMKLSDLMSAMDAAMKAHLNEIDIIANNPEAPTFDNTIVALERAGEAMRRVYPYYDIWRLNKSSAEFREIQRDLSPKLAAYRSLLNQNEILFSRVKAVYESDELVTLTSEEQRITWLTYNRLARNGASLNSEAKARYAEINTTLASLQTQFANNVLADEENYVTFLTDAQLDGLPESLIKTAAKAAEDRGKPGAYAITNTRSSMDPFLTYSTNRKLREKVWTTYYNRGDNNDEFDNNAIVQQILALRYERVSLLGYQNYAQWRLENRMAKTPEKAMALMMKVWPAAIARVKKEVADMQAIADRQGDQITIKPWDYRFYAEKVRKAKYDLDSNEVKQYLQLDKLRDAMFYVAGRLFNFDFNPLPEGVVPVFHPDVKVWEVTNKDTGSLIGLWYLDPFAREGKRSGAWATTYRSHTTYDGKKTVLSSNNSNFVKGPPGEVTLISWDDAETYFHEFGHALHFLSATVTYPTSHTGVRDYTEFQSQLLERWLTTDEVINNYLVHYQTGEPIPKKLIDKIKQAATFNEGFKTTEYLASAIMDLVYHTTDPATVHADNFEQQQLLAIGMPEEVVMRHRTTHFNHIFSSESYAAGYYGYMWAEVLTADTAEVFASAPGGFYDQEVASRLIKYLFSVRNALDPADAYRKFRGRDASVEALMRDRGFLLTEE